MLTSILIALMAGAAAPSPALTADIVATAPVERVEFRLRNDTGSSVRLHTGRGTSSIGNNSSNRYQAEVGQEFRLDSSRGALLFEVSSDMDGETYDLSDFL